jgi:hypothetical protein
MENKNTAESLRLLTNAHAISWSSSDDEKPSGTNASLMTPLERSVPRHHGLIQSKIVRQGNDYKMYLESSDTSHLIYAAEKKPRSSGSYALYDGKSGISLGSLAKTATSGSTVSYSLEIPKNESRKLVEVAKILYEVPSVLQALKDGPPRRAHVVVPGRDSVETKEPYCKEGGQRGLDFRGRGREPSCKNMQLQNSDGKVVLQIVKWAKDAFHVDFGYVSKNCCCIEYNMRSHLFRSQTLFFC